MIVRRKRRDKFVIIPNELFEDPNLAAEEMGCVGYLLSRPDDWTTRHDHLARHFGIGLKKLRRMMANIERAGWADRDASQGRDEANRFTTLNYTIYDTPRSGSEKVPDGRFAQRRSPLRKRASGNKKERYQELNNAAAAVASGCTIAKEALELAARVGQIAGIDPEFTPPSWCGAALKIEAWLRSGWTEQAIVAGVQRAMARRPNNPPRTVAYFEQAIADVMAELAKPLPEGAAPQRQYTNGHSGKQDVSAFMQSRRPAASSKS